jgi:hypothetical protein
MGDDMANHSSPRRYSTAAYHPLLTSKQWGSHRLTLAKTTAIKERRASDKFQPSASGQGRTSGGFDFYIKS